MAVSGRKSTLSNGAKSVGVACRGLARSGIAVAEGAGLAAEGDAGLVEAGLAACLEEAGRDAGKVFAMAGTPVPRARARARRASDFMNSPEGNLGERGARPREERQKA